MFLSSLGTPVNSLICDKSRLYYRKNFLAKNEKYLINFKKFDWIRRSSGRKECYFGEVDYHYESKSKGNIITFLHPKKEFPPVLLELKKCVEGFMNERFDMVFCNWYTKNVMLRAHQDSEIEIEPGSSIACLSFGGSVKVKFFNSVNNRVGDLIKEIEIEPNSLYVMMNCFQRHYYHQVEPLQDIERFSFTFRRSRSCRQVNLNSWDVDPTYHFVNAKETLEQYPTPDCVALDLAELIGEKAVIDLGVGTGSLSRCFSGIGIEIDESVVCQNVKISVVYADADFLTLDSEVCSDKIGLSNPPFGYKNKNANLRAIEFFIRNKIKLFYMLHKSNTLDYINYRYKDKLKTTELKYYSFPLYKTMSSHKEKVVGVCVSLVKHELLIDEESSEGLQNQVLYSLMSQKHYQHTLFHISELPDVDCNYPNMSDLLDHYQHVSETFPVQDLISKYALDKGMKIAKESKSSGSPVNYLKGQRKKIIYPFSKAALDYQEIKNENAGMKLQLPIFKSLGSCGEIIKRVKIKTEQALTEDYIQYQKEIDDGQVLMDDELKQRIIDLKPQLGEHMGKDFFSNRECLKLNVQSLSQYGSFLDKYSNHTAKMNKHALYYAWYAMKRRYNYILKDMRKMTKEEITINNQSSPGFPYNLTRNAVNSERKPAIQETYYEMKEMNANKLIMPVIYNAFTKLDLMPKSKRYQQRIISSSPTHYTIMCQEYTKQFEELCHKYYKKNSIKIGISKFFQDWNHLVNYLTNVNAPYVFEEIDASGWDHRIIPLFIELFYLFLLYEGMEPAGENVSEEEYAQVIEGHVSSIFVTALGEFVSIFGGQKSGHANTCMGNSWIHEFFEEYVMYVFWYEHMLEQKLKEDNEAIKASFSLCFEFFYPRYVKAILGDDKISCISVELYDLGFDEEFRTNVWREHLSVLLKPGKSKFNIKSIEETSFLSQSFKQISLDPDGKDEKLFVPVPTTQKVLDSVIYFRDESKISYKLFKSDSGDKLREAIRLVRLHSALINSFFNQEVKEVLFKCRQESMTKLNLTDRQLELACDNAKSLVDDKRTFEQIAKEVDGKIDSVVQWLINKYVNVDESLTNSWSLLAIKSMYLQEIRSSKYKSNFAILNILKNAVSFAVNAKNVVLVSPKPSGKKSWLLHLVLEYFNVPHEVKETQLFCEDIPNFVDNYDYVFIGENKIEHAYSAFQYVKDPRILQKYRYPFINLYYAEIMKLPQVLGISIPRVNNVFIYSMGFDTIVTNSSLTILEIPYVELLGVDDVDWNDSTKKLVLWDFSISISQEQASRICDGINVTIMTLTNIPDLFYDLNYCYFKRDDKIIRIDQNEGILESVVCPLNYSNTYSFSPENDQRLIEGKLAWTFFEINSDKLFNHSMQSDLIKWLTNLKKESVDKMLLGTDLIDKYVIQRAAKLDYVSHQLLEGTKKSLISVVPYVEFPYSYDKQLRRALSYNFTVVQGPPGAGKTTFIAQLTKQLVNAQRKVIILSVTNINVQNISEKLDALKIPYVKRRPGVRKNFQQNIFGAYERLRADVTVCTPGQLTKSIPYSEYDLIVDECGLMPLGILSIFVSSSVKLLCCVGDPAQRAPYQEILIQDRFSRSVFGTYETHVVLDRIYRLPRILCEFISKNFYNSLLVTVKKEPGQVIWTKTILMSRTDGLSQVNLDSHKLYLKNAIVLTPYLAHAKYLQNLGFDAHTIDSFQGREAKFVVLDFCVHYPNRFIFDPQRINVAFSRASEKMQVVIHEKVYEEFIKQFKVNF